jgi:hypothetical protein
MAGPGPLREEVLNLFDAGPVVLGQAFAVNRSMEPLNACILLRLARQDVRGTDAPFSDQIRMTGTDGSHPVCRRESPVVDRARK